MKISDLICDLRFEAKRYMCMAQLTDGDCQIQYRHRSELFSAAADELEKTSHKRYCIFNLSNRHKGEISNEWQVCDSIGECNARFV